MTESDMRAMLFSVVSLATADLSNDELATLNLCTVLGSDPRGRLGADKYLHLFDATDATGKPVMNDETKRAIAAVVAQRFSL